MSWTVLKRFITIGRVLRTHRVLHLLFSLWPSQAWYARLMRRIAPLSTTVNHSQDAAQLRQALESLGPIFIKLGQVLSTRPDLLPTEYITELSHLQANITPLDSSIIRAQIEQQIGQSIDAMFEHFDNVPVATASLAQVHRAVVKSGAWAGRDVAVKVLRPGIDALIKTDIRCLYTLAKVLAKHHRDGQRLRPVDVVSEIDQHLTQELDLQCEAANTSVLRHNFKDTDILALPEVYWDLSARRVMTLQWMHGVPISHVDALRAQGFDLQRLARDGVEIFFTQVFRDGFFHADMHPGNIFIGNAQAGVANGHYIGLDCGIVGSLSDNDRYYLAINFLAFFRRDYRAIAEAHVRAGWVPADTSIEALTTAIRTSIEPSYGLTLSEVSLGEVLVRLFDIARQFNVAVQPQLVLLQKTLLNIEGLGRILYPQLDLWETAYPFLEKWMKTTLGPRGILNQLKKEWPYIVKLLPSAPRQLLTQLHEAPQLAQVEQRLQTSSAQQQQLQRQLRQMRWLLSLLIVVGSTGAYWLFLRR